MNRPDLSLQIAKEILEKLVNRTPMIFFHRNYFVNGILYKIKKIEGLLMAKKNHHYIPDRLFEEQWEDSTKRVLALYNFIERTVHTEIKTAF